MLTPSSINERPLQYVQQLRQIIPSRGSGGRSRTFNVKIIFAIAQFVKFVGIQLTSILRREPSQTQQSMQSRLHIYGTDSFVVGRLLWL